MNEEQQTRKPNRQVARSRRLMQEALSALLKEKPYQQITISEISEKADLARRTFYEHFNTKDDLLLSVVDDIVEPFFAELGDRIFTNPLFQENSEIAFISLFRHWQENAEMLALIRQANIDMHILLRLREWFYKLYLEAVYPKQENPNVVISGYTNNLLAGATFMILTHWADEGMRQSPEVMGKFLYSLIGPPSIQEPTRQFTDQIK